MGALPSRFNRIRRVCDMYFLAISYFIAGYEWNNALAISRKLTDFRRR